jgi:hypothetical protein
MYPVFLGDVADAMLADKRHAAAARHRAQIAARANRKSRRAGARHTPAPAPAGHGAAAHYPAVPDQASGREYELTCAPR